MTFMQTVAGKILQSFLDEDTKSKMFITNKPDDVDITKTISLSQLEKRHGGTAPDVTRYWPPIMPPYPDYDPSISNFKAV